MIWTKGCHSPVILITEHVAVSTKDSIPLFCKQSAWLRQVLFAKRVPVKQEVKPPVAVWLEQTVR